MAGQFHRRLHFCKQQPAPSCKTTLFILVEVHSFPFKRIQTRFSYPKLCRVLKTIEKCVADYRRCKDPLFLLHLDKSAAGHRRLIWKLIFCALPFLVLTGLTTARYLTSSDLRSGLIVSRTLISGTEGLSNDFGTCPCQVSIGIVVYSYKPTLARCNSFIYPSSVAGIEIVQR